MNKGIWYAIGAYVTWGLFPIYWKWLHQIDAVQLVSHRILWSFVILLIVILLMRQWQAFRAAALAPRVLRIYGIAALLIAVNWLTYVWAVNAGFIVETSLGYFINPLISVLLGVIFLRERLRPWQWGPIGLAATGVLYLTLVHGSVPWIALTLAFSFGTYGLVKKTAPLGSIYGLTVETGVLLVPAILYLLYSEMIGQGALFHAGTVTDGLLVGAGVATTIPLLMFASAARRIPLSSVGILQYISPTLQFLLGVLIYKEAFESNQLVGYGIVWAALILFAVEGFIAYRTVPVGVVAE
jgi:chloramphenicol-sensitive protein RarD